MKHIINILNEMSQIDGWLIEDAKVQSSEVFFVKSNIDMNRRKRVHDINVTVYTDFGDEQTKYRGSSTIKLSPSMSENEIKEALNQTALAASYVKNLWYPLAAPSEKKQLQHNSNLATKELALWQSAFIEAMYKNDIEVNGGINSAELFLEKNEKRIINSYGVDVSETTYTGQIELIVDWNEPGFEEVELFEVLDFSSYNPRYIEDVVFRMITEAKARAKAKQLISLSDIPIILTGIAVPRFMSYFVTKSSGQLIYEKISDWNENQKLVSDDSTADPIQLVLEPIIENSSKNAGFDEDGFILEPVAIIENSVLKGYHMPVKYAHYLEKKATGNIRNIVFEGGKSTIDSWKEKPHLELNAFSDFQIDFITGEFGGEIRLATYFNGEDAVAVTGGLLTGNIKDVIDELKLSKEKIHMNNYYGPKSLLFKNVIIAGD